MPPEIPVLFLDECIGGRIIAADLRKRGIDVRIQDELPHIPRAIDDSEWAKAVAAEGWVAVSRDKRIRHRVAEKQAIATAGFALFILTSRRNLSRVEIVDLIANAAPRIPAFPREHQPPFIAAIHSGGKIEMREIL